MPPTSGLCLLLLFALISMGTYEPASPPALSLVVAVDVSGSARDSMGVRGTELVKFFRELIANDSSIEIALVGFNEATYLMQDFTRDLLRLEEATWGLRSKGRAKLYSAVWVSVEQRLKERKSRRALLIISDGNDVGSEITPKAALQAAKKNEVAIFTLGIEDPPYASDLDTLERLSKGTRGLYIRSSVSQFPDDLARIAALLRGKLNGTAKP